MDKKIFNDIVREYDLIRSSNMRKSNDQKKNLYIRYPKLKKLEDELNQTSIKIAKVCLIYNKNRDHDLAVLKNYSQKLSREYDFILNQLGLTKNYFEIYNCNECKDTGFINNKKCKCFLKKLIERYYDMSNIKEILKHENFSRFNINFYSNEKLSGSSNSSRDLVLIAKKKSIAFVNNFDAEFNNLLFFGPTGLGKTFLCNCIAKEILDMGKTVLYFTSFDLFRMLNNNRLKSKNDIGYSEFSKEQMIFDCDLLIIDDLGTEISCPNAPFDLFNIINTRLLKKKHVIISTNLGYKELSAHYTDRILSRLFGSYKFYEFAGIDIRLKKHNR